MSEPDETDETDSEDEVLPEDCNEEVSNTDVKLQSQLEWQLQWKLQCKRRLSVFAEPDLTIKIEGTKLHVNKAQLTAESPVFERMFTSDFKEKQENEIELERKDLNEFVDFLRCTLPGIDEMITDKSVHYIAKLADEYQASKTMEKADSFLATKCRILGDTISSEQIIKNIKEAERHNLPSYLEECINIASKAKDELIRKSVNFDEAWTFSQVHAMLSPKAPDLHSFESKTPTLDPPARRESTRLPSGSATIPTPFPRAVNRFSTRVPIRLNPPAFDLSPRMRSFVPEQPPFRFNHQSSSSDLSNVLGHLMQNN